MLTLLALYGMANGLLCEVNDLLRQPISDLRHQAQMSRPPTPLVLFAPIYMSSVCQATCTYCAFRKGNTIQRRTLKTEEAWAEAAFLQRLGYDAAYCLTGSFVGPAMTRVNAKGLRAICEAGLFPVLESSPFTLAEFGMLCEVIEGKGRYVLFQEVYDQILYATLHDPNDPFKGDPEARLGQLDLALDAQWPEVGIGMLIGLNPNLSFEVACLVAHYRYLLERGAKKVTISVPRLQPATGVELLCSLSDEKFLAVVYALRILCPEADIVLTGRERADVRDVLRPVTNIWGVHGSTVPGGYTLGRKAEDGQFMLTDRRTVEEIRRAHSL